MINKVGKIFDIGDIVRVGAFGARLFVPDQYNKNNQYSYVTYRCDVPPRNFVNIIGISLITGELYYFIVYDMRGPRKGFIKTNEILYYDVEGLSHKAWQTDLTPLNRA